MNKALVAQGFLCIVTALGLSAVQLMSPTTRANALETVLLTPPTEVATPVTPTQGEAQALKFIVFHPVLYRRPWMSRASKSWVRLNLKRHLFLPLR